MRLWMLVASELATQGSVIAKQERVLPSSNGSRNRSRWKGVANLASSSMLPVSGAEQFVASCDSGDAPISSHSGAYSRVVSPAPSSSSGRNRFQRPRSRASALSSSMTGGWKCGSPDARTCSRYTPSDGSTRSPMKSANRSCSSRVRALGSKSMPSRTLPGSDQGVSRRTSRSRARSAAAPAPRGRRGPTPVGRRPPAAARTSAGRRPARGRTGRRRASCRRSPVRCR